MSTTRFTPGPWEVESFQLENDPEAVFLWIGDRNNDTGSSGVCDLYHKSDRGEFCEKRNAEANAHLIAASPDLYDALQHLLQVIDSAGLLNLSNGVQLGPTVWYVKASEAVDIANATLAKARGEASK